MSSGSPERWIGCIWVSTPFMSGTMSSDFSRESPKAWPKIGVAIPPGQMQFTRTPLSPSSNATEPAEPSHGLGDRRLHVRLAADVGVHVGRATADLGGQPLAAVVLEVGEDDRGALGDEQPHGRLADAAGAAGDERRLARQSRH